MRICRATIQYGRYGVVSFLMCCFPENPAKEYILPCTNNTIKKTIASLCSGSQIALVYFTHKCHSTYVYAYYKAHN